MDKRQFFDRIPQESQPEVGAHVGLGTREEFHTQITGFTTITLLGDWETPPKVNARGASQGTVQGCHVSNTCAMPMICMLNKNYSLHAADIVRIVVCQYIDNGCSITVENPRTGIVDQHPAQGILVDVATYAMGVHEIDIPRAKVQYYTNGRHKTLYLPTKEKRGDHLGCFWHTDTPAARLALLQGAEEIHTGHQAIYLGCTINFSSNGSRVPHNLSEIRRGTQQELELLRLAPAAVMMLIGSQVPTTAVPSVYKPTVEHHRRNDTLLMRMYKQLTRLSPYAKTAAVWAP